MITGQPADQAADEALLEAGRLLFAKECTFMLGVAGIEQLPDADLPEIAFCGRSNVGKSSLLNALTRRRTLARTSNTPGRTQELNFFDLGGRLRLVDLPGYGYAQAPKSKVDAWTALTRDYLRGRPSLQLVLVLIDARHGLKPNDKAVMADLAAAAVPFLVVLTKADLIKPGARAALLDETESALRNTLGAYPQPHLTSSAKGDGIPELRARLAAVVDAYGEAG